MIDHYKADIEMDKAWVAFKKQYCRAGKPSITSFVAGWNACKKTKKLKGSQ